MAEPTPGPLAYRPAEFDDWGFLRDGQGHLVAVAKPGRFLSRAEEDRHRAAGTDPSEANARRIVALWNACEGIPTEELEGCADYGQRYSDPRHRLEMLSEFARDASYEQPEPPPVEFDEDDDEDEDDG